MLLRKENAIATCKKISKLNKNENQQIGSPGSIQASLGSRFFCDIL
ncbi:hypothetical protein CLOM621_07250 [Clostridium sp. M62/1]|nr:hypothetical protein CLOM621_07250 [Clostridium sp. M62/1]